MNLVCHRINIPKLGWGEGGVCMAPHTPAMLTTRGLIFHPWTLITSMRDVFVMLILTTESMYLSWMNVNFIIWMVRLGVGDWN